MSIEEVSGAKRFPAYGLETCYPEWWTGKRDGKAPLVGGGFKKATDDPDTLDRWKSQWPLLAWALPAQANGWIIVDIDNKKGDGFAEWEALVEANGGVPSTFEVTTPSGGKHLYFAYEGSAELSQVDLSPNINTRWNGYVMAPGAAIVDPPGCYAVTSDVPIAPAPEWLVKRLTRAPKMAVALPTNEERQFVASPTVASRLAALVHELAEAPPGAGNTTANDVGYKAGQYAGAGQLSETEAFRILSSAVEMRDFSDGKAHILNTLERAIQAGLENPRAWSPKWPMLGRNDDMADTLLGMRANKLLYFNEVWYEWSGVSWVEVDRVRLRSWVVKQLSQARYTIIDPKTEEAKEVVWPSTRNSVLDVMAQLESKCLLSRQMEEDGFYQGVVCQNGIVDIGTRRLVKSDPSQFIVNVLPFDFDSKATAPQWLEFLKSTLDEESIALLQEWFGYVVSGRTDLQKMMLMVGKPRAGKGIISEMLASLVGADNVASPKLSALATNFGPGMALVGKSLATITDASWSVREQGGAIELIKAVTGEDRVTLDRKNREPWTGQLRVRFNLTSNDEPRFSDSSSALSARLLMLHFENTFEGREDTSLRSRLLLELAGILNWSLDGLARLDKVGWTDPAASATLKTSARRQGNPITAWVEDAQIVHEGFTPTWALFESYEAWCIANRLETLKGGIPSFGKYLRQLLPKGSEGREPTGERKPGYRVTLANPTRF